jgi:hypothetical protein
MFINTFYIGANILFDLETGKTSQILLLATSESSATYFTKTDAENYLAFVVPRAERFAKNIKWTVEETNQRTGMYVIRGVQYV